MLQLNLVSVSLISPNNWDWIFLYIPQPQIYGVIETRVTFMIQRIRCSCQRKDQPRGDMCPVRSTAVSCKGLKHTCYLQNQHTCFWPKIKYLTFTMSIRSGSLLVKASTKDEVGVNKKSSLWAAQVSALSLRSTRLFRK